jgi:PAS domain S-box-containing protein
MMNTFVSRFLPIAEGALLLVVIAWMLRSAWHRQLLETASEGIWVIGNDGLITYANARMAEMLGVPLEVLTGRKAEDYFFPADLSLERARTASLTSGFKEQFDRRLRRGDASEMWVLACCNPIRDDTSAAAGSLAMMTDITERKRAEAALLRSEERFRNLFEGMLEGVYQSTPEGRVIAANPMLLRMLGYQNEAELNDVHIASDLYIDSGMRARLLDQLDREGGFQNVEYQLRRRDGEIISVVENARAIRNETGEVLYYEGTLTDITERKRIEEQLRQAQKAEALASFSAGIAHDFNNVLSAIKSHATNALRDLESSHAARISTEQALRAAESATELTGQLLSFNRRPVEPGPARSLSVVHGNNTGENILLVEDEPMFREVSRDMLEREGYRVTVVSDGLEADRIGKCESGFDLLITRSTMADMTGGELARRLRPVNPGLKVLFIAGYSEQAGERGEPASAMSDVLQKPFSADSLGRKVRQLLDRR